MTFPENDTEFEDNKLIDVKPYGDNHYEIQMDNHLHFAFQSKDIVPKVGDRIRIYGAFGRPVRGVFINGREIYYRNKEQEREKHLKEVEEHNRQQKAHFEASVGEMDAKFDALPDVFRRRIERYRKNNPDFRWQFEAYEVFCCEQAVAIAEALKTKEAIGKFHDAPWEEQKKLVPKLDDGHSGNTFGKACQLAAMYVTVPEYIPLDHGAMAILVGCEEFGCPPVSKDEVERVKALYGEK